MTLTLSIPQTQPATPPDTVAMMNLISDMRGCNRNLDAVLNSIPKPLETMTAMGADDDGISRGLVWADAVATYVIYLDAAWALSVAVIPRHGVQTVSDVAIRAEVPARLRRTYGVTLGRLGAAA